ncbi:MAG: hypothetical protein UHZ06_01895 [Paludibacteraceae bacterium]|nr:hypothetical protein [Paludibacteraceae bacterium]
MEEKKEYDLLDLIRWGWGIFVQYCWNPFVFLVRFGLKKWYFMLLAVFVGFGIAYITPKFYKTTYSGQMIIKTRVGQSSDYINTLQALGKESAKVISKKFEVPIEAMVTYRGVFPHYVYPIDTLNTGYFVDSKNKKINSNKSILPNVFAVEVRSSDSSQIRLWGDAIVNYFKKDEFVKNANNIRLNELRNNIAILQNEIAMLDSLREIEYLENSRRAILVNDKSGRDMIVREQPRLMHNDVIDLHNRIMYMQNTLTYMSDPVEVISPMSLNAMPLTHWTVTYKKYIFLSVVLMYGLLLVWHFRKEIIAFVNKD